MSLVKKEKVVSVEEFENRGERKKVHYRVGDLLTFKDDATGKIYQRLKLSIMPNQTFLIFEGE